MIPYKSITLVSDKSAAELATILELATDKDGGFTSFIWTRSKYFRGTIKGSAFILSKNLLYANAYNPIVTGTICQHEGNSVITCEMKLRQPTCIFIDVYNGMFISAILSICFTSIPRDSYVGVWAFLFIFVQMIFCGLGFSGEARAITKKLKDISNSSAITTAASFQQCFNAYKWHVVATLFVSVMFLLIMLWDQSSRG